MLGNIFIHVVYEHQVGLARLNACCQQPDPKRACVQRLKNSAVFWADKVPLLSLLYSVHEGVRDDDSVV